MSLPVLHPVLASPFEALFRLAVTVRNALYDRGLLRSVALPGITISIGNIALGGTGKSPMVMHVARLLLAAGAKPAILTRGYGSDLRKDDSLALLGGEVLMPPRGARLLPDEARMQSALLSGVPVIAGPNRAAAAARFLREKPEFAPTHWLLDDGFQHRQLKRTVDLVLLDAREPFGNGHTLPRGPLREGPAALRRASAVIFTRGSRDWPRANAVSEAQRLCLGPILRAELLTGALPGYDPAQHQPALLAAGIAKPDALRRQLEGSGVRILDSYTVPDHAPFDRAVLAERASRARSIVTTAKDYWRDPSIFAGMTVPVLIVPLDVRFDTPSERQLLALLASGIKPSL